MKPVQNMGQKRIQWNGLTWLILKKKTAMTMMKAVLKKIQREKENITEVRE